MGHKQKNSSRKQKKKERFRKKGTSNGLCEDAVALGVPIAVQEATDRHSTYSVATTVQAIPLNSQETSAISPAVSVTPAIPRTVTPSQIVMFGCGHPHIRRAVISYALMGCSVSQFTRDVTILLAVEEMSFDMFALRGYKSWSNLRKVHRTWTEDVDRILDRFACTNIENSNFKILANSPNYKTNAFRLVIVAHDMGVDHLKVFKNVTNAFSNVRRLFVSPSIGRFENRTAVETGLADWLQDVLSKGHIEVLRWEGPRNVNVLKLASGTLLKGLILEAMPEFYDDNEESNITLPELEHATLRLTNLEDHFRDPERVSTVLKFLCRVYLPRLMSITVVSSKGFPHLEEFIETHSLTLRRLRVYKHSDNVSLPAVVKLPSMPKLEEISWQISDLPSVIKTGRYECLTELELFGFSSVVQVNSNMRRRLTLKLIGMITTLRIRRATLCPRLSIVRVHCMTLDRFRRINWDKLEEATLGYCFHALKKRRTSFLSEDGWELHPMEIGVHRGEYTQAE